MIAELWQGFRMLMASLGRAGGVIEVFDEVSQATRSSRSVQIGAAEFDAAKADPLTRAAYTGDIASVQNLLDSGRTPNIEMKGGTTPLACAAGNGHVDIVRLLLASAAQVDAANGEALKRAADSGHFGVVLALLNAGAEAEVDLRSRAGSKRFRARYDFSALEYAVHGGHAQVVKALLSHGANPNGGSGSALRMAASEGRLEIVSELLERGAAVNSRNRKGHTALGFAAAKGHAAVVRKLLEKGAEVTQSILRTAMARPANEDIVQMLRTAIQR